MSWVIEDGTDWSLWLLEMVKVNSGVRLIKRPCRL